MKEYKAILIGKNAGQTTSILNDYAQDGWELICSYSRSNFYLIMEREIKEAKKNGL